MATTDISGELAALQLVFKQQLHTKISEIESFWESCKQDVNKLSTIAELHHAVHSLAGSGGTFGAIKVGTIAREIEQKTKEQLIKEVEFDRIPDSEVQQLEILVANLGKAASSWEPSAIPYIKSGESQDFPGGNLIYLAEDDELLAADLILELKVAGFTVKHFTDLNTFEQACIKKLPAAVIMDVVFKGGNLSGTNVILKLKDQKIICPPVIFISVRDDMEARLAAARAGASRYFCKPLNMSKVVATVDGLTSRSIKNPFKVLIIDDDETLLSYYSTVLRNAGMIVECLSKPLEVLDVLYELKPDITLLDVYMSGCSGPELAQVIRQDDTWAMMPIMYLSSETDLNLQLDAMHLGGDDFLVKPIGAGHLLSAVTARAKRARWSSRLNNDLTAALRESKYQLVTMDQHDIVSTTDTNGTILSANEKFCEVSGYSREELIGRNHNLIQSGFHTKEFYKDLWDTIAHGKIWHGTVCNRKKNGDEYWVESTIVPFLDEHGKPYKYVSARTDVTEVRQSEQRLKLGQTFANIGSWDWNILNNELYWSDLIWTLFGYDKAVTETTYDNFIAAVHPDDRQLVIDAVTNCVENGAEYNIEHRVVWQDGSVHWLHESGDVVRNTKGEPLHMLGVVQYINDRKQAELDLVEAREEAEDANRAKSQFLSSMSHELRTPMNAILGFSQLLIMEADPPLSDSQSESVEEIQSAGTHLLELINEVLDLSKIESGHIDLSIGDVVLGEVIAEAIMIISPLADNRGIDIEIHHNGEEITFEQLYEENYTARADKTRLKQVLINLLSNAVKYNSENGKIIISCEEINNSCCINVTDTGAGLNAEQQKLLFKPFERIDVDHTDIEGTGIGLVITKNIIEIMGGSIGVQSEPGVGSTFWIALPVGDQLAVENNRAREIDNLTANDDVSDTKKTVLYIEDNPANLRLVAQLLGRIPNLNMLSAHEPVLGLELAIEHCPDLILLDINLPGMSGFEVLKQIRQRDDISKTPVIAISANAMPRDIEMGMEAGFDSYITKPIDVTLFLKAISGFLE